MYASSTSQSIFTTMDTNGIIKNTHSLETTDGVTTKTTYKADGYTINDNVTEKWEANFQNYEKV